MFKRNFYSLGVNLFLRYFYKEYQVAYELIIDKGACRESLNTLESLRIPEYRRLLAQTRPYTTSINKIAINHQPMTQV